MAADRQRIDRWLFFARLVKSRSLAARLVQAGRVRVNRDKAEQASQLVKPGDVLTVLLDRRVLVCRLRGCGSRRGPAAEAQMLYEDLSPTPAPRDPHLPDELVPQRDAPAKRTLRRARRAASGEGEA